jgi:ferritin-like protein
VFAGAPQPQDVQGWLRELGDGEAFALRAFHPVMDLQSGIALFRRVRRRS